MKKLTKKELKLVSITIATWGLLFAGSGLVMNSVQKPPKIIKSKFEVTSKRVSEAKTNEIKLKDIELEINQPLSVNVKDYLAKELPKVELTIKNLKLPLNSPLNANPNDLSTYIEEELSEEVKKNIIIDLSQVRTDQEGRYDYSVTYNGIIYKGKIEVYQPQTKIITPNQTEENEVTNSKNN